MLRLAALVAVALVGCGAAHGPTWPKSAGTARLGEATDDGGESLAPQVPSEVAAIEAGGEVEPEVVKPEVRTAVVAPAAPDAGAGPATPAQTPQLIELEEEIIITDGP
jgi:hypothetical protein